MNPSKVVDAQRASESQHWYTKDGKPAYTIIGANGKERNCTLRDARKEGLVPSVTTILQCASKPGLVNWMIDQAIMAALTLPKVENEADADYLARIKADASERARKARERGTEVHGWVQSGFEGQVSDIGAIPYYKSAVAEIERVFGRSYEWVCEESFATDRYGGKIDQRTVDKRIVLDWKTTDKPLADLKLWDEHYMQLGAYGKGIGAPTDCVYAIGYLNSVTPECRIILAEADEIEQGWQMFNALTDYWYAWKKL